MGLDDPHDRRADHGARRRRRHRGAAPPGAHPGRRPAGEGRRRRRRSGPRRSPPSSRRPVCGCGSTTGSPPASGAGPPTGSSRACPCASRSAPVTWPRAWSPLVRRDTGEKEQVPAGRGGGPGRRRWSTRSRTTCWRRPPPGATRRIADVADDRRGGRGGPDGVRPPAVGDRARARARRRLAGQGHHRPLPASGRRRPADGRRRRRSRRRRGTRLLRPPLEPRSHGCGMPRTVTSAWHRYTPASVSLRIRHRSRGSSEGVGPGPTPFV